MEQNRRDRKSVGQGNLPRRELTFLTQLNCSHSFHELVVQFAFHDLSSSASPSLRHPAANNRCADADEQFRRCLQRTSGARFRWAGAFILAELRVWRGVEKKAQNKFQTLLGKSNRTD